jgi:hypothetical protein
VHKRIEEVASPNRENLAGLAQIRAEAASVSQGYIRLRDVCYLIANNDEY